MTEFRGRLLMLRGFGYAFPDHMLTEADQEIQELAADG